MGYDLFSVFSARPATPPKSFPFRKANKGKFALCLEMGREISRHLAKKPERTTPNITPSKPAS